MIIESIKLENYKAFECANIKSLDVSFTAPVQISIADNGMGKSQLQAALNVTPAVRSNYHKGGSIELSIAHEGSSYIIQSDFSKREKAHSFIKDGIELNDSGTTHTSAQLAVTDLGVTPLVNSLMYVVDICGMGAAERKGLFLSAYPNDMTFILTAHKKVNSELRGFRSNIKLLKERKSILQDKLIEASQLTQLRKLKDKLIQDNQHLDQLMLISSNNINNLSKADLYTGYIGPKDVNLDDIRASCTATQGRVYKLRNTKPELFKTKDHTTLYRETSTELSLAQQQYENLRDSTISLKHEIEEFTKYFDTDIESEITETKLTIDRYTNLLSKVSIDTTLHVLSKDDVTYVETQIYPQLLTSISNMVGLAIIEPTSLATIRNKVLDIETKLRELRKAHEYEQAELQKLYRVVNNDKYRYPKDCITSCEMKDNIAQLVGTTQKDIDRLLAIHEVTKKSITRYVKYLDVLSKVANNYKHSVPYIEEITNLLNRLSWKGELLGSDKFISILKHKPFDITTTMSRILENSKAVTLSNDYNKALDSAELKLKTLHELNVSHKLISKSMVDKQVTLKEQTEKYLTLRSTMVTLNNRLADIAELKEDHAKIQSISKGFEAYRKYKQLQHNIQFNQIVLNSCSKVKADIQKQLLTIEASVTEQLGYKTRLDDEITPMLDDLIVKEKQWSLVESALAPNGLPRECVGQFLNVVIHKANTYLSLVWGYDFRIIPLDLERSLDFRFKVDVGTEVPDIGRCSKGQRDMINLAWTLALRDQIGIQANYPLFIDEIDSGFSTGNRERLFDLLSTLTQSKQILQLFIINHHIELFEAFTNSEVLCLSGNNITLPKVYNTHANIK